MRKQFTGKELAEANLFHLNNDELRKYLDDSKKKVRVHSDGFFARMWRRISPDKIFLIRFKDGHGLIIMADNEYDACINSAPFLTDGRMHSCQNPRYDNSCKDCREYFDNLATRLNEAHITWLGWGQPDYNWVIHI